MTIRYVAIGDSFTEGVGDERPDGTPRGWADRLAGAIAAVQPEPVYYANFAIRGRLLDPIIDEQLDVALSLDPLPTHLTLNGGGNDMMRPKHDMAHLVDLTRLVIERCHAAGVTPVILSGADPSSRLPMGKLLHRRAGMLTDAIAELTAETGTTFVDAFHDAEIREARYWSGDRLHLGGSGHARVASLVLEAFGFEFPGDEEPVVTAEPRSALGEARYYREHVLPWVGRRLTGRSSGDGREAKFPNWTHIEPPIREEKETRSA